MEMTEIALASKPYDKSDYIGDYDDFLRFVNEKGEETALKNGAKMNSKGKSGGHKDR